MSVTVTNANNRRNKKLTVKNNAPFRSFISKINDTSIVNVEDLDIAMPMYKLLEIVKIIQWHQEVCGIIIETKQMMLLLTNVYVITNDI